MTDRPAPAQSRFELLETRPAVAVDPAEYWRLLGYPADHEPSERALELVAWARQWYAENGRPWVYLREAELQVATDALQLDGVEFRSQQLHDHLIVAGARRAMLLAASAGLNCEEHARRLWQESKPDEYFFLEMFGSAVVEHLVASLNGRICDLAERAGQVAIPHYSPGYTGWNIADQNRLFEVIARGLRQPFPEPFEVFASGMLRPKKSLLGVVGLTAHPPEGRDAVRFNPCESCGLLPCQYRRRPYRHSRRSAAPDALPAAIDLRSVALPLTSNARYTVSERALQKWSAERVQIERRPDGAIVARFRFDGTTCSNLGQPLAFDYVVELGPPALGCTIQRETCLPAPGDEGRRVMCAGLSDASGLMRAIAADQPLLGQPLDDVLRWTRNSTPSGCLCTAGSREHKWGLALEAIHYTLAHSQPAAGMAAR